MNRTTQPFQTRLKMDQNHKFKFFCDEGGGNKVDNSAFSDNFQTNLKMARMASAKFFDLGAGVKPNNSAFFDNFSGETQNEQK